MSSIYVCSCEEIPQVHIFCKTIIFAENASLFWSMITDSYSASNLRREITPSHQQRIQQVNSVNTHCESKKFESNFAELTIISNSACPYSNLDCQFKQNCVMRKKNRKTAPVNHTVDNKREVAPLIHDFGKDKRRSLNVLSCFDFCCCKSNQYFPADQNCTIWKTWTRITCLITIIYQSQLCSLGKHIYDGRRVPLQARVTTVSPSL
jgi:hypothetical protein